MNIGETPFEKVDIADGVSVFAKLESYNFSGSVKARMAYYMLMQALQSGELKTGGTIIEATTGNTGIAFSALASRMGLKMVAVMPDGQSIERVKLMKIYGAEVILTSKNDGVVGAIEKRDLLQAESSDFWIPGQFSNIDNVKASQYGLGLELVQDLQSRGVKPDFFVHGIGTGGTLMGVAKVLKNVYPQIKIAAVEPKEVSVLTVGRSVKGVHGIQGIGEGFIPKIVDLSIIDLVEKVETVDAINEMREVVNRTGISMGISSGANIVAIKQIIKRMFEREGQSELRSMAGLIPKLGLKSKQKLNVVTVFADGVDRYLSLLV